MDLSERMTARARNIRGNDLAGMALATELLLEYAPEVAQLEAEVKRSQDESYTLDNNLRVLQAENEALREWIKQTYRMLPDHIVFVGMRGRVSPLVKAYRGLPDDIRALLTGED